MILLLLSFLLGSVPFGLLIARAFHVEDLRQKGSGNIGATNVSRVVGLWPAGVIVFVLDLLKGALPAFVAGFAGWHDALEGAPHLMAPFEPGRQAAWAAALVAVLGHCFSPWLRFRGGKGVATGFGAFLVLAPLPALAGFATAALIFAWQRVVSIASISGVLVAGVGCILLGPVDSALFFGALLIAVILFRHEENVDALLSGRERTFR